jgi:hypothetical protein
MIFSRALNNITPQRRQHLVSLRERQSNYPWRIFVRRTAAADLMGETCSNRSEQFHHHPPLHPRSPGFRDRTGIPPRFWTVSQH